MALSVPLLHHPHPPSGLAACALACSGMSPVSPRIGLLGKMLGVGKTWEEPPPFAPELHLSSGPCSLPELCFSYSYALP